MAWRLSSLSHLLLAGGRCHVPYFQPPFQPRPWKRRTSALKSHRKGMRGGERQGENKPQREETRPGSSRRFWTTWQREDQVKDCILVSFSRKIPVRPENREGACAHFSLRPSRPCNYTPFFKKNKQVQCDSADIMWNIIFFLVLWKGLLSPRMPLWSYLTDSANLWKLKLTVEKKERGKGDKERKLRDHSEV